MANKTQAISKLLSKVLEDSDHLKPYMFSTMEELIKNHPTKKGMTVQEWANSLKPGSVLKRRDQETGKLAQFNLNSEELNQSGFNKLLEQDPGRHVTKDQLLELLTPYEVKFDKPHAYSYQGYRDLSKESAEYLYSLTGGKPPVRTETPNYPEYKNFDSVINGAIGKVSGGANRLTLPEYVAAHADPTHPQHGHVRDVTEMVRDMMEDNLGDDEIAEVFGFGGLPRTYDALHEAFPRNAQFQEQSYDNYLSSFDDFASDIMGSNAEALPEFLTKDTRQRYVKGSTPEQGHTHSYPSVSGTHFTDDTLSHSRVNRAPILGDSDYVLSEVQSDLEPFINQTAQTAKKNTEGKISYQDGIETPVNAEEWLAAHYPGHSFLSQAPFLSEYPRLEMNRTLAEAIADPSTPDHLVYNNAFDANPSAPELMYKSRLPKEFQRLSRNYGVPLKHTENELMSRGIETEGYMEKPGKGAQDHFSGALPIKEQVDYLRRIGVPFLQAGPLALLLQQSQGDQ